MGFEPTYIKKLRLTRSLANDYASVKQHLLRVPGIAQMTNEEVRCLVANGAITYSLKHENELLNSLTQIVSGSRVNGANSRIDYYQDNWDSLVSLSGYMRRVDEMAMSEFVLAKYIELIKRLGCMP